MQKQSLSLIILAAGKGTRMKSDLPKVLHKVANREMLNLVIDAAKTLNPKNITLVVSKDVLAYQNDIKSHHPELDLRFVLQKEKLGTGHATKAAIEKMGQDIADKCLILYGDTPLISSKTMTQIISNLDVCDVCIAAFECVNANMYGRLIVDKQGNLQKIVEFKDANDSEKKINLCNSGIMAINGKKISGLVNKINNNNNSQEYYLTDIVDIATNSNLTVSYSKVSELEVLGVNSKVELSQIESLKQDSLRQEMMQNGVTLIDPKSTFLSFDSKIGKNCIIYPNVFLGNGVEIGDNVEIKSFSHIENAQIGKNCIIGPFARIRPQSKIADDCKIGNFVEIKKANIGIGTKINHLSYVGDCDIGKNSNIGAGTITCNYDGKNKYKTTIGNNSFIGSNCSLIAPISIGDDCLIGAGSVINKDVDNGDLAIARSKQINIKDGVKKLSKNKY